jgi:hypothetical protein
MARPQTRSAPEGPVRQSSHRPSGRRPALGTRALRIR